MSRKIIEASHECAVHWESTHLSKCPRWSVCTLTYNKLLDKILKKSLVPDSASGSLYYNNSDGVEVRITGFEQLQHALDEQGSKPLKVKVVAKCSNFAMVTIRHGDLFLRVPMSNERVLSYKSLHARARNHFRVPSSCELECVLADPKHLVEQHRNIASDYDLKRVAQLIWLKDGKKDNLQLATKVIKGGNGINKSLPIVQSAPYALKVMHKGMVYRFTVARGNLFEELRSRVCGVLNLPTAAQFMLSYIDADNDNITMGDDNDLEDAIVVQSLQPLRVNVLMIEESNSLDRNLDLANKQANRI